MYEKMNSFETCTFTGLPSTVFGVARTAVLMAAPSVRLICALTGFPRSLPSRSPIARRYSRRSSSWVRIAWRLLASRSDRRHVPGRVAAQVR